MEKAKELKPVIADSSEIQQKEYLETLNSLLEGLGKIAGSNNKQFGEMVFNQLASSCYSKKEPGDALLNVVQDIKGIDPKDSIEGMLAIQMIATHHATMRCFSRAVQASSPESRHENLNAANKLTRSFTAQMEALNRHRGKGQQKVTVEHVHVHSGGQAIVGSITSTKSSLRVEGG
jgi:hypothetical protein